MISKFFLTANSLMIMLAWLIGYKFGIKRLRAHLLTIWFVTSTALQLLILSTKDKDSILYSKTHSNVVLM